jgi:lipid II:glycine glycyltransferase (peptidoglycan interpeptide bridge formation enzyme)
VLLQGAGPLRWAYVPRGPVPATAEAIAALVEWARGRRLVRLRVEPEAGAGLGAELADRGFAPATAMHPVHTSIVPLGPEDEMLRSFKPKHRYNIRLAARRGVAVSETGDVAELHRQHAHTARRQGIAPAALDAYRRRLERLEWCRVYVARFEDEPIAAIMVCRFAGRAYYLFGGSSGERHRGLMPTYAVQWAAMRAAAAAGCRDYELWGTPPSGDDASHPWHGLWQFKSGFGGHAVEYAGAWDMVLSPLGARLGPAATRLGRGIGRLVKNR